MKKFIIALAMGAMALLPLPAQAATPTNAPDAAAFAAQETLANQWIETMIVQQKPEEAYKLLSPTAQKQIAQDKVVKAGKDMQAKWGKMQALGFVAWERFTQADRISYVMKFEKAPAVHCMLIFDKQGGLENFGLGEMQQNKDAKNQKTQSDKK